MIHLPGTGIHARPVPTQPDHWAGIEMAHPGVQEPNQLHFGSSGCPSRSGREVPSCQPHRHMATPRSPPSHACHLQHNCFIRGNIFLQISVLVSAFASFGASSIWWFIFRLQFFSHTFFNAYFSYTPPIPLFGCFICFSFAFSLGFWQCIKNNKFPFFYLDLCIGMGTCNMDWQMGTHI
ncbi:hypothetical protein QBC43DRAFT_69882 [Cladorrhinum sp. PSN259]|nr:hypothetical protein QBC43DRAFT_69882 [Cladorrhinum sp. PSN259]